MTDGIADEFKVRRNHLAKVVQNLARAWRGKPSLRRSAPRRARDTVNCSLTSVVRRKPAPLTTHGGVTLSSRYDGCAASWNTVLTAGFTKG